MFVHPGSSLISVTDALRRFEEWYAEAGGPGNNGGDKYRGGSDRVPERFRSLREAIVAPQTNIGEVVLSTLGHGFNLALGHSEAVTGHLKVCEDVEDATQRRVSLIEKKRDELNESVLPLKSRVEEFSILKELADSDIVVWSDKWDSLKEALAARDVELEGPRVTVRAKLDFVECLKSRLEQQKNSFERAKAALEKRLTEAEGQLDAVPTEMTADRDRLRHEVDLFRPTGASVVSSLGQFVVN